MENLFRIHRENIKEHLLGNFHPGINYIEAYVKTSIPYNWRSFTKYSQIKRITTSDYEETLINYLESAAHNTGGIIIVGEVGSGKTTTLQYCIDKANRCRYCPEGKNCSHKPSTIMVDFFDEDLSYMSDPDPSNDKIDNEENYETSEQKNLSINDFWKKIFVALDNLIEMNDEEEQHWFWPLLISEYKSFMYLSLYRLLEAYKDSIINDRLSKDEYRKLKDLIYIDIIPENLLIYKLIQVLYTQKKKNILCNLVLFDNIDSIEPKLQREALRVINKISEILQCRSIIPMRPNTFEINLDAAAFREVLDHWAPDIFDVLSSRIKYLENKEILDSQLTQGLTHVLNAICNNQYRKELFVNTCGISIRYATRNFYNLLLSPLIFWQDKATNINTLGRNEFYEAYFGSETEDTLMYRKNFVNLYTLEIPSRGSLFSLIKIRILHYLSLNKVSGMTIGSLRNELEMYGYSEHHILLAMNDLLRRRTACVWSDTINFYSINQLKSRHLIFLSPLGEKYFNELTGDIYYFRECICKRNQERIKSLEAWVNTCWSVFKELERIDYKEIIIYLEKSTSFNYQLIYSGPNCISLILWKKLLKDFNYFFDTYKLDIDIDRENYIRKNVLEILRSKILAKFNFDTENSIYL